jgi:hypothetical protein
MSYVKFDVTAEIRKALKGKKTAVGLSTLFHVIAPNYLRMLADLEIEAAEQKDIDELERVFRLEDPR